MCPTLGYRRGMREQVLEAADVVLLPQGPLAKAKHSGPAE
jgi:hypothetical protein